VKYLTYSGNNILSVDLPPNSQIIYTNPPIPGYKKEQYPDLVRQAFEKPLGMEPLKGLVDGNSKILIAFDDNCQPFPPTAQPDFRQLCLETLLPMLYSYGVNKKNIHLMCAVALHRKMKEHELRHMVGNQVIQEFLPTQLTNFDA